MKGKVLAGTFTPKTENRRTKVAKGPIDFSGIKNLEDSLNQVKNIRSILIGGSVEEGTFIIINLEKPVQLLDVLRTMPTIEQAGNNKKKKNNIIITLKPPISG